LPVTPQFTPPSPLQKMDKAELNADKDDKFDIRAENIAALCCYCHLRLDRADHIRAAQINRERRKRFREPLLPYFCAPPLISVPCTEAA
jgi:hypothetical protein